MKLSKAILLGSKLVGPKAGAQFFPETRQGCALGMAAIARGCTFGRAKCPSPQDRRTLGVEAVWGDWVLRKVPRPCNCWLSRLPREMRIKDIIAHLFDDHVMRKRNWIEFQVLRNRNWTLKQLVEWVETVEPEEKLPPRLIPRPYPWPSELARESRFDFMGENWEPGLEALLNLTICRNPDGGLSSTSLWPALLRSVPWPSSQRNRRQYSA